jgi:hypothetical protein
MPTLPNNALGADLLWWRTSQGMRTTATLFWNRFQAFPDLVHLQAMLFDAEGETVASWRIPLHPDQPIFIDSGADGPWQHAAGIDGMLALYTCTDVEPSDEARQGFNRLLPLLDWRAADGQVVTLHSDQVVRRGKKSLQRFTEIVVLETGDEHNALVILNGEEPQPSGALEITIKNSAGISRSAIYAQPMRPFTAHRIPLTSLAPDLVEFSEGKPLLVSGTFASCGLFTRPYVETTGRRWGAYHAGDVYEWSSLPHFAHALIGGEVNPIAVLHDGETQTFVNLLHSHGDLEDDMPVTAALFDTEGACVAQRPAWRVVPRHGLARFDIAELLPDPALPFRGHIALTFAAEPARAVPCHLQALLEYRRDDSIARTMAWSDEWNSRIRLAKRDRRATPLLSRSFYRVWQDGDLSTEIATTNAGHADYDRNANVRLTLLGNDGQTLKLSFQLPPYATRIATIEQLFPDARTILAPSGLGLLLVESVSDLANLAFTRHRRTGAIAAEHFMALATEHDGKIEWPSGN